MRGHYRILVGMAAGVGKTYRMLQEGQQGRELGRDVVIGYLEPHDRPETTARAEGLEVVPRLRTAHGELELDEMDVDAVIAREPELALVDELAHSNAAAMRNNKRYEDIDEILASGINVISTVNIQHLESLNDAIFELTGVRVRETFPDRILDEADEVVLVDLSPEELQERLRAGKVYPRERAEVALQNFFRHENLAALRELVLREVAEDVEARRHPSPLEPLSQQAVAERILALIEPQPKSQRILRRAWRSAQRLGAEIDALWVRPAHYEPGPEEATQLAALRRLASVLGIHFIEADGDDLVEAVRNVAAERGSTYVFVGTPDERRRVEILRGSLAVSDGAGASGPRHPRRRRPGSAGGSGRVSVLTFWRHRKPPHELSGKRVLVPFTGGELDPIVLGAAIRIAHAEDATLVPAYLIVTPLEYRLDAPMQKQVAQAMPLLEAVEHAGLRAGLPVDARVETGRTPTHALQRLWDVGAFRPHRRSGSRRARPRLHAEGAAVDPDARTERDGDPPPRPDARRGSSVGAFARGHCLGTRGGSGQSARRSEPAAPLEERHQDHDARRSRCRCRAPTKAGQPAMLRTSQPKFWPKKPVMKVSGRKIVAITASCFITTLSRLETVERKTSIELVSRSR